MKKKQDVLFLCQYFYPEYISSASLPYDTAVALNKAGVSVGALVGFPKEYNLVKKVAKVENHKGIKIKRLKYIQSKRSSVTGRLINYFSFTFSVLLHFGELRKYKSVIVYSNPPILPLIVSFSSMIFKTKMIFVSYDVYPEIAQITNSISKKSPISKIMGMVNHVVFKHVDKVVALSNEMKDFLLTHREGMIDSKVQVIPNWFGDICGSRTSDSVDNKLFNSLNKEENLVISYMGNMGICQDIETILEAIRQTKDVKRVKYIFAGHGNKFEKLKSIIVKEKLTNVSVFEYLHGKDFRDALNFSDCFIVSLAEGVTGLAVPSKTYSYMMAGKPVIAIMDNNSDIARDLKENNAGYSMESGESSKLVEAIQDLLTDPEKRKRMGINCRRLYLKKYTKENCTKQYIDLVKEVLGE